MYNDLIDQVVGTQEWSALTSEEKTYILNFTPQQKAILAVLYDAGNNSASAGGGTKWLHCAGAALGLNKAYSLFANAFKVGMGAETALAALRFVGLKYLGYIALAVAIYEFVECVSSDGTIPQQLVIKPLDSYLLPLPLNQIQLYCTTTEAVLDSVNDMWQDTSIFQNPSNNKYYIDSNYTSFVPDGYYFTSQQPLGTIIYRIVDGVSIAAYTIETM